MRFTYTNQYRYRNAFNNKIRINYDQFLKKVISAAKDYKQYIDKLDDYEAFKDIKFPEKLSQIFGKGLTDIIIIGVYEGKRRSRKRNKKNLSDNIIISDEEYQILQEKGPQILIAAAKLPDPDKLWEIDWDTETREALEAFKGEAFKVANIHCEDLVNFLKDEASKALKDGIPFQEWKKGLELKGFEADNPYYLRTNFNTAMNNSYLAGNWFQAQEDKDIFPYLRYVAVMDDRVREEHAELHGTIKDIDDPFWDIHYPPNGWNCRCDVEQLMKSEAEEDPKFGKEPPDVEIDENFRKNTGKDQTIWGDWI